LTLEHYDVTFIHLIRFNFVVPLSQEKNKSEIKALLSHTLAYWIFKQGPRYKWAKLVQ